MRPWKGSMISTMSLTIAARGEELAALLAFRAGELAEEIFVDPSEGVVFETVGNLRDFLEQLFEQSAVEDLIRARQHTGELRVVLLDIRHRLVDFLADVARLLADSADDRSAHLE